MCQNSNMNKTVFWRERPESENCVQLGGSTPDQDCEECDATAASRAMNIYARKAGPLRHGQRTGTFGGGKAGIRGSINKRFIEEQLL